MTKAVLVACLESAGAAANQAAHTPYEYGYRVPLLVISPFVKSPQGVQGRGLIDSTVRSDAAILDFIEKTFSVPGGEGALGTLDQIGTKQTKSDDL
jgi:phospholipase C